MAAGAKQTHVHLEARQRSVCCICQTKVKLRVQGMELEHSDPGSRCKTCTRRATELRSVSRCAGAPGLNMLLQLAYTSDLHRPVASLTDSVQDLPFQISNCCRAAQRSEVERPTRGARLCVCPASFCHRKVVTDYTHGVVRK
jgi:hypothetical protein